MDEIQDLSGFAWIQQELKEMNRYLKKIAEELEKISKSLYALRMQQKSGGQQWRRREYW